MQRIIMGLVLTISISSLHFDIEHGKHTVLSQHLTEPIISHLQRIDKPTSLQSIKNNLGLIDNQINLLSNSHQQVDSLHDVEVIGNQGSIISCKNVSKQDKKSMKSALQNIDTDLWSSYFEIQQYFKEGQQNDDIGSQYQQLKASKQQLQASTITFCPQKTQPKYQLKLKNQDNSFEDVSTNKFYSNLNANNNWTYGKLSEQQYQIIQFQFLLNNNGIKCPQKTPFTSGDKCISCPEGQIFFLDTSLCGSCPNNTKVDPQLKKCEINKNVKCSGNQVYNQNTKSCECSSGLLHFDGQTCVGCFIPNFWNSKTKKCEACPYRNYYSLTNQTCLQCPSGGDFISSSSGCHDQCTLSKPYFNGQGCIYCPQVFNSDNRRCQSCPSDLLFDKNLGTCVKNTKQMRKPVDCPQGYIYNYENGQCIKENSCQCPSNYAYNSNKSKCECPSNLPYDTGKNCVQCLAPEEWNNTSKKCVQPEIFEAVPIAVITVPKKTTISSSSQNLNDTSKNQSSLYTTTKNVTTPSTANNTTTTKNGTAASATNSTITTKNVTTPSTTSNTSTNNTTNANSQKNNCKSGQLWDYSAQKCICSSNTPYKTQQGCIQCYSPTKWSQSQGKCIEQKIIPQCKSNFIYDPVTKTCVCPPSMPFTNGQICLSCYLPMYWSHTQKQCMFCPLNQFFNPINRKCQNCSQSKPILVNHVCQTCPSGTQFNIITYRCQNMQCFGDSSYSYQKNDCYCRDPKKPFYNGRQCVQCLSPNRWDLASRSCVYGQNSNMYSPSNTTPSLAYPNNNLSN